MPTNPEGNRSLVNEWCGSAHTAAVALHIMVIRVICTQKLAMSGKFLGIDVNPAWYTCILPEWKGPPWRTLDIIPDEEGFQDEQAGARPRWLRLVNCLNLFINTIVFGWKKFLPTQLQSIPLSWLSMEMRSLYLTPHVCRQLEAPRKAGKCATRRPTSERSIPKSCNGKTPPVISQQLLSL